MASIEASRDFRVHSCTCTLRDVTESVYASPPVYPPVGQEHFLALKDVSILSYAHPDYAINYPQGQVGKHGAEDIIKGAGCPRVFIPCIDSYVTEDKHIVRGATGSINFIHLKGFP